MFYNQKCFDYVLIRPPQPPPPPLRVTQDFSANIDRCSFNLKKYPMKSFLNRPIRILMEKNNYLDTLGIRLFLSSNKEVVAPRETPHRDKIKSISVSTSFLTIIILFLFSLFRFVITVTS